MLSSSSSVAFSSSAARAIEVHSSRHCISSSAPSLASLPSSPSSLGGSCSSAFSASKRAIRSRSFSCIAIDHSAFQPSACICRMATSCMNIWFESSARGRMSSSSARAASSCAPKSSFAGGNVIVGMPAPRAERCDGSVVRLMLILGTLTGGTGAARALQESPLMPPPSQSLGTTGTVARGLQGGRAAGRVVAARRVVRRRLAVDLATRRAGVLTTRELLLEGRRRRRASAQLLGALRGGTRRGANEKVVHGTVGAVAGARARHEELARARRLTEEEQRDGCAAAISDARGVLLIAKPLRPG